MKTYENKEELLNTMLDMDINDVPDIIAHDFDDADDIYTTFAKMACNVATRLVENAGGEARFDVDAMATDIEAKAIIDRFTDVFIDLCEFVVSRGEITGIEVLDEE